MSRAQGVRWPVWLVFLGAAALMSLPLPDMLTPLRPPWATLVVIYWTMMWPRQISLGSAWVTGLILDVLQGSVLGQHALALTMVSYITMRFHLQIRIFPLWQLTATVFALLLAEAFILFWIDGVAGHPATGYARWTQALTGAVLWPLVMAPMDRLRERLQKRDRSFN